MSQILLFKLWDQRIEAASEEHGLGQKTFLEGLARVGPHYFI